MKEHNKKTLVEALSSLKEHQPPDDLWMKIEDEISGEQADHIPSALLKSLPQYEPPANVWDRIEQQLAAPAKGKIISIRWKQALAVAASLALLLVAYWQLNKTSPIPPDNVTITYSEETVDPLLLEHDWDEDEEVFQEYLAICEGKQYICEQPEFRQMQQELEELTSAKEDLKEAVGAYGSDPELITQIKEIELERTGILKKMMVMLI